MAEEPDAAAAKATVAVVIPNFNLTHFLVDAINSVLAQTRPVDEIIVVDDGSVADPTPHIAKFKNVRLIRQENRGTSAARNRGLQSCQTTYVVFLDADDRLLPTAVAAGLTCIAVRPECAFVYGGYRLISEDGRSLGMEYAFPIVGDAHLSLLRRDPLGPPATALFRRDCLMAVKGFDETVRLVEDYDLILRIAQRYPVASHSEIVAEYRRHGKNLTNDYLRYLKAGLQLLDCHEARITADPPTCAAIREGRADIRNYYVPRMLNAASARWGTDHHLGALMMDFAQAARFSPRITAHLLFRALRRRIVGMLALSGYTIP